MVVSSNFNYKKAEKITSLRPLLDQTWITTKIAPNIMKVGMLSYLPNVQINLRSNFNSEKLVKSETPLCFFAKVGLKVGENISQRRESSCASLSIKWTSKCLSKFQFWETAQKWNSVVWFHYGWAKGVKIIPRNVAKFAKICVHTYLLNGYLNLLLHLISKKLEKKCNLLGLGLTKFD